MNGRRFESEEAAGKTKVDSIAPWDTMADLLFDRLRLEGTVMTLIKHIVSSLAVISVVLAPSAAHASCRIGNLAGKWQLYSVVVGEGWVRCAVSINASGAVARSSCGASDGTSSVISRGKLRMANQRFCAISGNLTLGGGPVEIAATMSMDKIIINGVGLTPESSFLFNMTKVGP